MRSERLSAATSRRRVLFVGGTDLELPLQPRLAKKWDAVSRLLNVRVIARARTVGGTDPRFRPVRQAPPPLRGVGFYASLPVIAARELHRHPPDVIITQSPYEAFALLPVWKAARPRPKLLVELHGDWRTAPRLYGSRTRRLYAGVADRAAEFALRQADGTRAVSEFTARLATEATGRRPLSVFPTYFDLESFTREPPQPLPDEPSVVWVGVLQRYKNPLLLADAWRRVASRLKGARLVIVGKGPLQPIVDGLVEELPESVTSIPRLTPAQVAGLLDNSTLLAMSSESEGLPRVIMEAFARGRPVVSTAAGGIPDVVKTGRNGVVVERGNPEALADALVRVLGDRSFADRLGAGALKDAERLRWTPPRYAHALEDLVERALAAGPRSFGGGSGSS